MLTPTRIGQHDLTRDELKMDKRGCKRIGPCGFGQKAIYLNSFFISSYSGIYLWTKFQNSFEFMSQFFFIHGISGCGNEGRKRKAV